MTRVCGDRYSFCADEVKACEKRFGAQGDPLSKLYEEKLGYGLKKPKLLEALVDIVLTYPDGEFDEEGNAKRPLVEVLKQAVERARLNHQPVTRDIREENQVSGHLGDPLPD